MGILELTPEPAMLPEDYQGRALALAPRALIRLAAFQDSAAAVVTLETL
jgi:hypothetical protein